MCPCKLQFFWRSRALSFARGAYPRRRGRPLWVDHWVSLCCRWQLTISGRSQTPLRVEGWPYLCWAWWILPRGTSWCSTWESNQHCFELSWKVFKKLSIESWKVWAGTFFYPDLKVRPWKELLPSIAMMDNAYRPRKDEDDEKMPHSFLFRRRDCALDWYKPAVTYRQWINVKSFQHMCEKKAHLPINQMYTTLLAVH